MSTFLNSGLLWALPLAVIPLVLHLLTLHRLRTVELSTFRFLFDSYVQQRRRMKFLEALLAILRVLFIMAMVMVVARPVVKHWDTLFGASGQSGDVIMLVDCSASMNARTTGETAMKRAQDVARAIHAGLKPDDRLTLVRVNSQPSEIFSRFASEVDPIRDDLDQLKSGPSRANFLAALQLVFGPQAAKRKQPTVYLLTDCQSSGWREVRDQPLGNLLPRDAQFKIINVGSEDSLENRAVLGSPPRQRRAIVGLPVVLRPRVANFSKTETLEITASVIVDQKEVDRVNLSLKPGETGSREIVYVPREPGVLHGRFEIPADRFPDDDDFLFTLAVAPAIKILVVNGAPAADPLDNETLYLSAALSTTGENASAETSKPGAELLPSAEFLKSLDIQEIPENQLNEERLRDARVVILANCGSLGAQHFAWLRKYVKNGGGLLVLPGDKVTPSVYNDQFFRAGASQETPMTELRLEAAVGDVESGKGMERFGSVDYSHPVLGVFENPDARYLSTVYVYRHFPLTIPQGAASIWRLADFAGGDAALVECRYGEGLLQVASFPANSRWSNLPLKPEFVPLMLRLMSHMEHRPDLDVPGVVAADAPVEINVSEAWGNAATAKVTSHRGDVEQVSLHRGGSRFAGAYEKTSEKGYYTVQVQSGPRAETKGTASFAVNLSSDESRFESAKEEQFRTWLPGVDLEMLNATAEQQQVFGRIDEKPNEIWRPLIYLMFLVIAAEFLLATLGGGRADNEEPLTVMQRLARLNPGRWAGQMTGAGKEALVE